MTHRDEDLTLGEELQAARLRKKLTQDELAKKVGISGGRWTVRRWEKDVHLPEPEHRRALVRILSLPAGFFDAAESRPAEARLSHRVDALEKAVARIERRLFDAAGAQDR